jgi:ComF family protein
VSSEPAHPTLRPLARAGRRLLLAVRCGLFRPRCRICGSDLVAENETVLCGDCLATIAPAGDDRCIVCGRFLSAESALCGPCLLAPPPFERHRSFAAYEGTLRQAIILYKFGEVEPLKHPLAELYRQTLARELPGIYAGVVPVPADRRRRHGFQPLRACARVLARRLGIPLADGLLLKRRSTPPQVGLTRAQRLANLDGAFALAPGARVAGLHLLLLDDVTTTGATLRRCAAVLRRGGARVAALTLAQTRL